MEKQQSVLQSIINFFKKNSFKFIVILVLLTFLAMFIYALGFMIEPFTRTKESGVLEMVRGTVQPSVYAEYGITIPSHSSNYYDFYLPANDFNRFLLVSSVILFITLLALKMTGSTRRIKFYLSNFITCAVAGVLGIVFSIVNITSLSSLSNKWDKNVEKGIVDATYQLILADPNYTPDVNDANKPGYFNAEGTDLWVAVLDANGNPVMVQDGPYKRPLVYRVRQTSILHTMNEDAKIKATKAIQNGNLDYEVNADYIFNIGYTVFTCVIISSTLLIVFTAFKGVKQIKNDTHKRMGAELDE